MKRYLWVVEIKGDPIRPMHWLPTVGAHLDRASARQDKKQWEADNRGSKFRIRKYVAFGEGE